MTQALELPTCVQSLLANKVVRRLGLLNPPLRYERFTRQLPFFHREERCLLRLEGE